MRGAVFGLVVAILTGPVGPVTAQQFGPPAAGPPAVVLTIDSERLFLNSEFGKRVARELEARGAELAAENRQIETELSTAEQDLTDRRAEMTAEEFRPLADAFDARVVQTRAAQAEKARELNLELERERERFLSAAGPVLEMLMLEAGASVILERRSVFISANSSDITAAAVARLDADLGDGSDE